MYHEDLSKRVDLMKLGPIPENIIERILMKLGLLPAPLLDTQVAYTLARTIMLGVHADVFEALALEALPQRKSRHGARRIPRRRRSY